MLNANVGCAPHALQSLALPWQIGEIACRIGQLYYQFYLRKGDTCYLDEAYVFYEAIRARQYLGISCPGVRVDPRVVLRRLRYYVRFCAVCLLMGRRGLLLQLLTELDSLVRLCCVRPQLRGPAAPPPPRAEQASQNQCVLSETDRAEWSRVLSEFHSFVQAGVSPHAVHRQRATTCLARPCLAG